MIDLSRRSTWPEVMDDADLPAEDYARALADLARVNRVTFTHRPVIGWLQSATRTWPSGAAVSVLDVASGQGDLLRAIHRWGTRRGFVMALSGIDLNPRSAVEAAAATPAGVDIVWRTGDVFDHVPDPAPDFIVTSQFVHHLDDAAVVAFLGWMDRHARRGWFVADLHRHVVAYYGFPVLARLMGWHRIVRGDGMISIARGFRRADWVGYLERAGLVADIAWHPLFRYGVGRLA